MHSVYDEAGYCCPEVSKPCESAITRCLLNAVLTCGTPRLHTGDSDTYDHRTAWIAHRLILLLTRDVLYATSDGAT